MDRCDIAIALAVGASPLFFRDRFLEPLFPYPDQTIFFKPPALTSCSLPSVSLQQVAIDDELATIWEVMEKFCLQINLAFKTGDRVSPRNLLEIMASVMYRLLRIRFDVGCLNEAVRLGLLAFASNIFLHPQSLAPSDDRYSAAYRTCALALEEDDATSTHFRLWLLTVGALSALTRSNNACMIPLLRASLERAGIQSWGEMQHILESFLWIGHLHDKSGKDVLQSAFLLGKVQG